VAVDDVLARRRVVVFEIVALFAGIAVVELREWKRVLEERLNAEIELLPKMWVGEI